MTKKPTSTFDRHMQSPRRKKQFDRQYREFVLSELLLALMEEDEISVRDLAKEAGISPTVIQQIRSKDKGNLTLATLISILDALGYSSVLEIEKRGNRRTPARRFPLSSRPLRRKPSLQLRRSRKKVTR